MTEAEQTLKILQDWIKGGAPYELYKAVNVAKYLGIDLKQLETVINDLINEQKRG